MAHHLPGDCTHSSTSGFQITPDFDGLMNFDPVGPDAAPTTSNMYDNALISLDAPLQDSTVPIDVDTAAIMEFNGLENAWSAGNPHGFVSSIGEARQVLPSAATTKGISYEDSTNISAAAHMAMSTETKQPSSNFTETQPIGFVLPNYRFSCLCSATFARVADFKRHETTKHKRTAHFYCRFPGCHRSKSITMTGSIGKSFPRKDKRDEHEWRVHNNRHMGTDDGLDVV